MPPCLPAGARPGTGLPCQASDAAASPMTKTFRRLGTLVDVISDAGECSLCIGEWKQIVEIRCAVGRPGEVLGNKRRLVAIDQRLETPQMNLVERLRSADRHAYSVKGDRVVLADTGERVMRRTARSHIIFGMNLKESVLLPAGQDRRQMFVLEAGACKARNGMRQKAGDSRRA